MAARASDMASKYEEQGQHSSLSLKIWHVHTCEMICTVFGHAYEMSWPGRCGLEAIFCHFGTIVLQFLLQCGGWI